MSSRGLPVEKAPLIAIPAQFWRALSPDLYIKDASLLGLEPPEDFAMRTPYASKFVRQLVGESSCRAGAAIAVGGNCSATYI